MKFMQKSLSHSLAALAVIALSLSAAPAFADDTAVTEAVQALADAVTASTTTDGSAAGAETSSSSDTASVGEQEAAADEAAGLPKFKNRAERHEYLKNLKETDPDKFREVVEKRRQHWMKNHPDSGGRPGRGRPHHPGDYTENRLDRREDFRDRREDRWDARHHGGKWDRIEDRMDRREDVRDRQEDRWDAHHGPDRGRPGRGFGPRESRR